MAIYKQIFPTKYPLFEFYFRLWRLEIGTNLMQESMESLTYEYIRMRVDWKGKNLFHFRMYDTQKRQYDRLDGILQGTQLYNLKRLYEIRRIANEEIKKLKKGK